MLRMFFVGSEPYNRPGISLLRRRRWQARDPSSFTGSRNWQDKGRMLSATKGSIGGGGVGMGRVVMVSSLCHSGKLALKYAAREGLDSMSERVTPVT